jgi:hypothetical protein
LKIALGAATAVVLALMLAPAAIAAEHLEAYEVRVENGRQLEALAKAGFDVTEARVGSRMEIGAYPKQAQGLRKFGMNPKLKTSKGESATQFDARAQAADGSYDVYRPYFDHTYVGTVRPLPSVTPRQTLYEEMTALAAAHTQIVKPKIIGTTINNKPILALRVTKDAREPGNPDGSRPAVLYISAQHAREWITPEMTRRLAHLFIDNYGGTGPAVGTDGQPVDGVTAEDLTNLVNTRELWFVVVSNPDGYDWTFTPGQRLWRKNLHDNDANGIINQLDGVDPNRNYPSHWGYDDEGSSPDPTSETFRGTGPASENETKAMVGLFKSLGPEFVVNYHSAAELLLYGIGWQVQTFSADDVLFSALAGNDDDPAIPGRPPGAPDPYDPDVSSELYTTNGDTDDTAYEKHGILAYTPEMDVSDPARGGGTSVFEFQDVEGDVQDAFEKNVPFAIDLAKSADDPDNPESHLGNTVPDFQLEPFSVSFGNPQPVQVNAKRELGTVSVHWRINNGPEQTGAAPDWNGGERYGGEGIYFHRVRGVVTGTKAGDSVKVWFEAGGVKSQSFAYDVRSATGNPVLILAAEDYKGKLNTQDPCCPGDDPPDSTTDANGPDYLTYYQQALAANGIGYDVYDVDAEGRIAPDSIGVLSHYKAVVWYTGDDFLIREPAAPGQTGTSKLANDEILEVRDFLNEGGKLFYTGKEAAQPQLIGYQFNPQGEPPFCHASDTSAGTVENCAILSNDFLQYYLGAYVHIDAAVDEASVAALPMTFAGGPFGSDAITLNGVDSANNQNHVYSMVTTSSILGSAFPQFAADRAIKFDRIPAFDPYTGTHYAVADSDDNAFQRLRRTIDLTGTSSAEMGFRISYDTEQDFDYVVVEAHEVGQDNWTTLRDVDGLLVTADGDASVGASCDINWDTLHPFLEHYQTNVDKSQEVGEEDCTATGTTGEWNGATGNSGGWQEWKFDLSAYAGKQVEISISYIQDFAVSGLGVFVDDWSLTEDGAITASTSFEDGLGGFTAGPAPDATSAEGTQKAWSSKTAVGYVEGPGVTTADSVYYGFGLEGVSGAGNRADIMKNVMTYLGVRTEPGPEPTPEPTAEPTASPTASPTAAPTATATPTPAPGGGGTSGGGLSVLPPRITSTVLRSTRSRYVTVRVRCPATSATQCRGTLRLLSGKLILAQRSFAISADSLTDVRMRLTRAAYRKLVQRGRLRATVVLATRGADGLLRTAQRRLSVLPPTKR